MLLAAWRAVAGSGGRYPYWRRRGREPYHSAVRQPSALYKRHRFPGEIISHAVWLYYWFLLNYRDVEELLAERGIAASDETIPRWCQKFVESEGALAGCGGAYWAVSYA